MEPNYEIAAISAAETLVRDLFMPYFRNFYEYQRYASLKDGSAIADLGTYMEGYEE